MANKSDEKKVIKPIKKDSTKKTIRPIKKENPEKKETKKAVKEEIKEVKNETVKKEAIKSTSSQKKKSVFSEFWKIPFVYWTVIFVLFAYVVFLIVVNSPDTQNDLMKDSLSNYNNTPAVPLTNEQILVKYAENTLKETYSPYYEITNFKSENEKVKETPDSIEVQTSLTMYFKRPYQDPDTVDYIASAKQKDPLEYQRLYNEYNSEKSESYKLVIRADLENGKVKQDTITVLFDENGQLKDFLSANLSI